MTFKLRVDLPEKSTLTQLRHVISGIVGDLEILYEREGRGLELRPLHNHLITDSSLGVAEYNIQTKSKSIFDNLKEEE